MAPTQLAFRNLQFRTFFFSHKFVDQYGTGCVYPLNPISKPSSKQCFTRENSINNYCPSTHFGEIQLARSSTGISPLITMMPNWWITCLHGWSGKLWMIVLGTWGGGGGYGVGDP